MSLYIHHVPGRLRVRTDAFRCQPDRAEAAARRLFALEGITDVTINRHAGSITVRYNPDLRNQGELIALLEDVGCVGARQAAAPAGNQVADLFGKALLGAFAQTVAQRSVATLVAALR
jgi:hypothetical protein